MATQTKMVKTKTNRLPTVLPVMQQEREIMAVGKARGWPFRVLGVAPVPQQPIFVNDWWLAPVFLDTSPIPARALERVRAVYEAGISPKAFVIAHQAEKQLAPPSGTRIVSPVEYWGKRVGEQSVVLLKAIGKVIAIVAPIVLAAVGTSLLLSLTVAGALVADPVLCAVTDDDVWIEIDEWMA
jgi:hypothetical protein